MTKNEIIDYFNNVLTYRSRTSYKYYFLKAIMFLGIKKDTIRFKDIGLEMLVQSWNDLSEEKFSFRKLDKLKDFKISLIKKYSLPEFSTESDIRKKLLSFEDLKIDQISYELTAYCPYLLLSYGQWDNQLKGIVNYHIRHKLIQEFSQNESCLYEIYDGYLILNSEYFDIIRNNLDDFNQTVNDRLKEHLIK